VSADPRIGTELGGYRIESLLGRGGMSVVYLAEHLRLKRKAALKLLSPELAEDPTFRARFVSEWERLAQLDHPNIIPVFEAGEADGLLFIAMRYVRTTDLKGLIEQHGRLEPDRAVSIISQTASALDAAHQQHLVHRDVKPANILIAIGAGPEGGDHAYLSDFGLTKHTASQSGLTQTGHFMGTIDYVAPEQISGKGVDGRTDQYALACVLYQSVTGAVPFPRDEETAALFAHLQDTPPRATALRPDLPAGLDGVIVRAMAKQKDDRFESCTAFARAAREAIGGASTLSAPPPPITATVTSVPPGPAQQVGPDLPSAPRAAPPASPMESAPQPRPGPRGGSRKAMLAGAVVVAILALGGLALTQLGGDDDGGVTGPSAGAFTDLVVETFDDNANGWETQPQNGIAREIVDGRYRFTIPPDGVPGSFAVSVNGTRGLERSDVSVRATSILVTKGGGGQLSNFGVSCRYTGADGYYFLIGAATNYSIQKLTDTTVLVELARGSSSVAIRRGVGAVNEIQGTCIDGPEGVTLTLIVNGTVVDSVVDSDTPIPTGVGGLGVTGQPGLVVDFEDFGFAGLEQASG